MAAARSAQHAERPFRCSATRSVHGLRRSFHLFLLPRRNRAHLLPHGHGAVVFESTSRHEQLCRWRRRSPLSQGIRPPLQRVRARWKAVSTPPSDRLWRTGDERARARGRLRHRLGQSRAHVSAPKRRRTARADAGELVRRTWCPPARSHTHRFGETRILGDEPGVRPARASRLQARHRCGLHVLPQRLPAFARSFSAELRRGKPANAVRG